MFLSSQWFDGATALAQIDINASAKVQVAQVVDAAGFEIGPVVPGQLISIVGKGLGPTQGVPVPLSGDTFPVSYAGTQVSVCGRSAPLLYVSENQINAIVPTETVPDDYCTISVSASAGVSEEFTTYAWYLAPSIFTANGSGFGQAAALNQDGSLNSASNPAPRGSILTLFGTGSGLTNPEFPDGAVVSQATQSLTDFVASVGAELAPIQYLGAAPSLVNGVMQVNLRVPRSLLKNGLDVAF